MPSFTPASLKSPLPEVDSLTDEELRNSVAGGASALRIGELGADEEEMRGFWQSHGLPDALVDRLAARAVTTGGVWADPPTLDARVSELRSALALLPLERLMLRYPDVLESRPETVQLKLQALSTALPTVDVLRMVHRRPSLLRRSAAFLTARSATILGLLPRDDLELLAGENPGLLEVASAELAARAAVIQKLYARVSVMRWNRAHAARMLWMPLKRLQRLEHVDRLNPGLRVAVPDRRFLGMADSTFHRRFVQNRKSHWTKRRHLLARKPPAKGWQPILEGERIPPKANLLQWGAAAARVARVRAALAEPDRGAAQGAPPPPRGAPSTVPYLADSRFR